ncbi:CHAD domain-containing protein [Microbulbifer mangrovi]|uniref:CHAD domain-containing protein n=1 Tax=Microbulbifer mangrovi TaxID=927787 RepID=UPI0023AB2505|nr:CHAD domain-containing protein [Microbulbifer mangrovi]
MPYELTEKCKLPAAVRKAAHKQVCAAIHVCHSLDTTQAVHSLRKHCKKMRALIRLFRTSSSATEAMYQHENARYRSISRDLSARREATSLYLALRDQLDASKFPGISTYLKCRVNNGDTGELLKIEQQLQHGLRDLETWDIESVRWEDIERGYRHSYRRAAKAKKRALQQESDEAFHTLRKRVKDQWYQSRLLKKRYPKAIGCRTRNLKKLASALGDWRDLRLLCHLLALQGDETKEMMGERIPLLDAAQQRLEELRAEIDHLCRKLFPHRHWSFR